MADSSVLENKEGWLGKLGEAKVLVNLTFKRRYFVLKSPAAILQYFEDEKNLMRPLGQIELTDIDNIKIAGQNELSNAKNFGKEFLLVSKGKGARTFILVAQSNGDANEWVRVLKLCHEYFQKKDKAPPAPLPAVVSSSPMIEELSPRSEEEKEKSQEKEKDDKADKLEKKIKELEEKYSKAKKALEDARKTIDDKNVAADELKKAAEHLRKTKEEADQAEARAVKAEKALAAAQAENAKLDETLSHQRTAAQKFEQTTKSKVESIRGNFERLVEEKGRIEVDLAKKTAEVHKLEALLASPPSSTSSAKSHQVVSHDLVTELLAVQNAEKVRAEVVAENFQHLLSEVAQLKADLKAKETDLKVKENELKLVRDTSARSGQDEESKKLRVENKTLLEKIRELENELSQPPLTDSDKLRQEFGSLKRENKVLSDINVKLEMQLAALKESSKPVTAIAVVPSLQNTSELDRSKSENKSLTEMVSKINAEKAQLNAELDKLKAEKKGLADQLAKVQNDMPAIPAPPSADVEKLMNDNKKLIDQVGALNEEKAVEAESMDKLRTRNKYLQDQVAKFQTEQMSRKQSSSASAIAELATIKNENSLMVSKIAELEQALQVAKISAVPTSSKNEYLEAKIHDLEKENEVLRVADSIKSENLRENFEAILTENAKLQSELRTLQTAEDVRMTNTRENLESLLIERSKLQEEVGSLKSNLLAVQSSPAKAMPASFEEVANLRFQLDSMSRVAANHSENVQETIRSLIADRSMLENEIQVLVVAESARTANLRENFESLLSDKRKLEAEIQSLKTSPADAPTSLVPLFSLEEKVVNLEKEIAILNDAAAASKANVQENFEALIAQKAKLEREIEELRAIEENRAENVRQSFEAVIVERNNAQEALAHLETTATSRALNVKESFDAMVADKEKLAGALLTFETTEANRIENIKENFEVLLSEKARLELALQNSEAAERSRIENTRENFQRLLDEKTELEQALAHGKS